MEVVWWHLVMFGLGLFILGWKAGRKLLVKQACDGLDTVIDIARARTAEELMAAKEKAEKWSGRPLGKARE